MVSLLFSLGAWWLPGAVAALNRAVGGEIEALGDAHLARKAHRAVGRVVPAARQANGAARLEDERLVDRVHVDGRVGDIARVPVMVPQGAGVAGAVEELDLDVRSPLVLVADEREEREV